MDSVRSEQGRIRRDIVLLSGHDATSLPTFSHDASDNTVFMRRFDMKAIISTHEFAYRNWMLIEPCESSHLTTDKRTLAGENKFQGKQGQLNKLQHNPVQERCCLIVIVHAWNI